MVKIQIRENKHIIEVQTVFHGETPAWDPRALRYQLTLTGSKLIYKLVLRLLCELR